LSNWRPFGAAPPFGRVGLYRSSQVCSALQPPAAAWVWPSATAAHPSAEKGLAEPPAAAGVGKALLKKAKAKPFR